MDIYTAQEVAYKNGYEAGVKEFAERLHQKCAIDRGFAVMPEDAIEITLKELMESKNNFEGETK